MLSQWQPIAPHTAGTSESPEQLVQIQITGPYAQSFWVSMRRSWGYDLHGLPGDIYVTSLENILWEPLLKENKAPL